MIFQLIRLIAQVMCVVVVISLLALTTIRAAEIANQTQSTINEKPSKDFTTAINDLPEFVHSLAELEQLQLSHGYKSYKVDIEAQLVFAARYWTVFFVQDGPHAATISCTDAATEILLAYKVGSKLRIVGVASQSPSNINLASVEIIDSGMTIVPTRVDSLEAGQKLPMNALVEVSCKTEEMFLSPHLSSLFAHVGSVPVELEITSPIETQEVLQFHDQTCIARGCLSYPPELRRESKYLIRMMTKQQIGMGATPDSEGPPADRYRVHAAKLVYSDSQAELVVEAEGQIRNVRSHYAFRLKPGDKVLIYESRSVGEANTPAIESSMIEMLSNDPLSESSPWSVVKLLSAAPAPLRVTLTAKVESMEGEKGKFKFELVSEGVHFGAIVRAEKRSLEELGIRVGDTVAMTGAPLFENGLLASGARRSFRLFVASESDLKFVSAPYRLSLARVAIFVLIGFTLLCAASTWNWLLRRQVQRRTARLNEVTLHLRKSFEAVREGVLLNNCEQRVSGFNQQLASIFGIQPKEGQPVSTHLSAIEDLLADRVAFSVMRQRLYEGKSLPVTGIIELSERKRTLQVFAGAIIDSDGHYYGNLWSFEDVSEKLSLENKLLQSQKLEAIGQLSGGIAHDFNNLLTIIRSSLMMMELAAKTNAPAKDFAQAAETAVVRAAELTQHLLDFSRRSTLQLQIIDANTLLKQVYQLIRRAIDSSIEIHIESSPQPIFINVDVTRLEQVLINLCINARDALPATGGRIHLFVKHLTVQGSQGAAVLVVKDNGSGMSEETQQQMFEPFFTTKPLGCGTGLGLSMAIGIVEQLGGRIECQSELGRGTTMQVFLPVAEPLNDSEKSKQVDDSSARVKSLRILLVDDEQLIRSLGQAILTSLGHKTIAVANGREAIDLLAKDEDFDAVLLDLTMPVMSGKETFQEIRRRRPTLPVTICSGYLVKVEDWANDTLGSPPSILQKPYRLQDLDEHLKAVAGTTTGPSRINAKV